MGATSSKVTHHTGKKRLLRRKTVSSSNDVLPPLTATDIHEFAQSSQKMSIPLRVWVAQCKLYSFLNAADINNNMAEEGLRELLSLKRHKEASYSLGCYYYDQKNYSKAYNYFYKVRKQNSFAQYRLALMIYHQQVPVSNRNKVLKYITLSAKQNNPYAQYILGFYHQHGILVKRSEEVAKMWYKRSADQGFAEAQTAMANILINENHISSSNNKEALNWLAKAKLQENANALIRLGTLHEVGQLLPKDQAASISFYRRAIKAPFTPPHVAALAHHLIGTHYLEGTCGLQQNNQLALEHLTAAADLGHAPSMRTLGHMYAKGIGGVERDMAKAHGFFEQAIFQGELQSIIAVDHLSQHETHHRILVHYQKAASSGSLSAQLCLATILQRIGQHEAAFNWFQKAARNMDAKTYSVLDANSSFVSQRLAARLMVARYRYNGWDGIVAKEPQEAFEEFCMLSEAGYTDAHYWLAACYEEGKAVDQDLEKAFDLYMKSAQADFVDGQFQVAYMLSNGLGTTKDISAALPWFKKAADQGHATAQYSLGLYYEHGLNIVPKDLIAAQTWYTKASASSTSAMVRLATVLTKQNKHQEAAEWLSRAIEKGDALAVRELAAMYRDGLLCSTEEAKSSQVLLKHYKIAFELYQQAAEKDDAIAYQALSKFYEGMHNLNSQDIVTPVDIERATQCLEKSEELGNISAALDLANLLLRHDQGARAISIYTRLIYTLDITSTIGKTVRKDAAKLILLDPNSNTADLQRAYAWVEELCTTCKDDREGLELLGYCKEHGLGTSTDKKEAIRLYQECFNNSQDEDVQRSCLYSLVNLYMEMTDYESAFSCLQKHNSFFTSNGCEEAVNNLKQTRRMKYFLGYLLLTNNSNDKGKGVELLKAASGEGEGEASYELGCYLKTHQGKEQEIVKAFKQGVQVNHAGCMRELALYMLTQEIEESVMSENNNSASEIFQLFKASASLSDMESLYCLGSLHESGFGNIIVQPNVKKALEYYIQAATKQHEPSMMKVGEILGGMLGCHEEAIHWFKKTSKSYPKNIMAKVMLISYELQGFDCGLSVESNKDNSNFKLLRHIVAEYNTDESNQKDLTQDEEEENPLLRKRNELCSEKNGMGHAYYILGQCYEFGRGTPVDLLASIDAYEIAVSSCDHIDAMWRLGMVYSYRFDNDSSALDWFRKASEKARHRDSHYQLGLFHLRGRGGLEINLAAAKRYFTKAAEQNHAMATYELARILWTVDSSHLKAYELFERAAQQNVPGALCHLGHFSYTGLYFRSICVVEKDLQKAFAYYSEAAQAGNPIAALMVGSHFEDKGNLNRALQWYESSYRLGGGGLAELAIGKIKHCMSQTDPHIQEEAIAWFESAAADDMLKRQSVFSAHVMIALYHLNGWGNKEKDSQKGFQMLLKIANMGGTEVFSLLAECYKEGIGKEHHQDNTLNLEKAASDEA